MTIRKASAVWKGGIKDGGGTISTETGVLKDAPYGFKSRFEKRPGHQSGRTDRCGPCRLLFNGFVFNAGQRRFEA